MQPSLTVSKPLAANSGVLTPYVTIWNSSHLFGDEGPAMTMSGRPYVRESADWDEWKFKAGVFSKWDGFTLDVNYIVYSFRGECCASVQEVGGKVTYELIDLSAAETEVAIGLRPFVGVFGETYDRYGPNSVYLETGIEPYTRFAMGDCPCGLSVPLLLGMSVQDYYFDADGDETALGYFSLGANFSMALPCPVGGGNCYLTAAIEYLHLIADNLQIMNRGRADEVIARMGISFAY